MRRIATFSPRFRPDVRFAPREAAITECYDKRMDDPNALSFGSQT